MLVSTRLAAAGFRTLNINAGYWHLIHDERRPVYVRAPEFQNDLLLFSSDRPGGLGGFDLYAVGVPRPADDAATTERSLEHDVGAGSE